MEDKLSAIKGTGLPAPHMPQDAAAKDGNLELCEVTIVELTKVVQGQLAFGPHGVRAISEEVFARTAQHQ
eukprot:7233166-Lingulodinium_polyedra.AAC.1